MTRKILIVGGTGVFGGQLATGILATTKFDVIIAGRDERRCEAFIARQDASARARLSVAVMDTGTVTARELVMTGAFVVVDAAGPYQGQKLCLPRAAIEAKMHYLHFADGRDFVGGIAALDAAARSAGVTILAGASSTPALTTAVLDKLRAGNDRGAMMVDARGLDVDGRRVRTIWTMIVEAGDGPNVPTLPALAAVKALADGRLTWRGAGPCVGFVPLEDIEDEFRRFRITTRRPTSHFEVGESLFSTALGQCFERLPKVVQAVHTPGWGATFLGQARVDGPTGIVAAVVARALNLPVATNNVPLQVDIDVDSDGERWMRDFGGRRFVSWLTSGSAPGHIIERFGPLSFEVALSVTGKSLRWDVASWRIGRIKLPRAFMPITFAEETEDPDGCLQFHVSIYLPFGLGRVVRYLGSLSIHSAKPTRPQEPAGQYEVTPKYPNQALQHMSAELDYV